jgi:DNA-binding beta-propeller fold protein YncE
MVSILEPATLAVRQTLPCGGFPIRIRFTPDGARVLVSSAKSGAVTLFEAAVPRPLVAVRIPYDSTRATPTMLGPAFAGSAVPIGLLASPDGRRLYVAASAMGEVLEVDLASGAILRHLPTGREPDGMGYSPLRMAR